MVTTALVTVIHKPNVDTLGLPGYSDKIPKELRFITRSLKLIFITSRLHKQ